MGDMHELAVTEALLEQVLAVAKKQRLDRVDRVSIRLGQFASFVDESIDFYWQILAKDTLAVKAKVVIVRIPGEIKCLSCKQALPPMATKPDLCPLCQSFKLVVVGGDELILEEITGHEQKEPKNHKRKTKHPQG